MPRWYDPIDIKEDETGEEGKNRRNISHKLTLKFQLWRSMLVNVEK